MIINKMNYNIDPSKVLSYLNEMGYYNITAIQLKSFLKDLKCLIKYVNQKKEENVDIQKDLFHSLENSMISNYPKPQTTKDDLKTELMKEKNDIFAKLHSKSTISSKAKSKKPRSSSRKNRTIDDLQKDLEYINQSSNHLKKQIKTINNLDLENLDDVKISRREEKKLITHLQPKYKFRTNSQGSSDQTTRVSFHPNSMCDEQTQARQYNLEPAKKSYIVKETESRPRKNILITNVVCEDSTDRLIRQTNDWLENKGALPNQMQVASVTRPKEATEYTLPNRQGSQPKLESFIRPRDQLSKSKLKHENLDSVQLYHKYKSEWDSQKIPGENKYSDLRWEIRHRMLGSSKTR